MPLLTGLAHRAHQEKDAYRNGEERPLGSYAVLMGAYGGLVAALSAAVKLRGKGLPERIHPGDLALLSVATHRLARTIAKDSVTSVLRAPFTTFDGQSGEAELAEQTRGTGPQKAIGELITCPFCLAQWTATTLAFGLVLAPRATRLAATVLTAVAAADLLQFAYAAVEDATTGGEDD